MTTRAGILVVWAAAVVLLPAAAEARCLEGKVASCVGPQGCRGKKECLSGHFSGCECVVPPRPCRICGRNSLEDEQGACLPLAEMCNGCDDDGDGAIDQGLACPGRGPFAPVCTNSSVLRQIPFRLTSLGGELPRDPTNAGRYANNISYQARIYTNPLVSQLGLTFGSRAVDPFDTFFTFDRASGQLTDEHGANGSTTQYSLSGAGQVTGIDFNFASDGVFSAPGFSVELASVTCGPQGSSGAAPVTEDGRDTFGLLTGTDDVMFFEVVVPNEPLSIWLDGVDSLGFDADLYARYDQFPERDVFDFASKNTGHAEEWINIDAPQAGRVLFVAVHSRAGAGSFNLRWARVKPTHRWSSAPGAGRPLRVGVNFKPTAAQVGQITTMISGAQRFMVGVTEGKVQLRTVEFFTTTTDCSCGGLGCDVCVHGVPGRASCVAGVTLTATDWNRPTPAAIFLGGSRVMAHELGHCLLGLDDEYRDHGNAVFEPACFHADTQCTHSVMGHQRMTANLCSWFDHGRDPVGPTALGPAVPGPAAGHVCSTCPLPQIYMLPGQSCTNPSCNACFLSGKSDWQDLVDRGHAFSAPTSTPNHRTYELFRGMPFTVLPR